MPEVRLLRTDDDRSQFRSGNLDLDRFFIRFAGQNQFKHHIGATYVAVDLGQILGFVTVAPSQVEVADLPEDLRKRLPTYPIPVLRLARLAVQTEAQGRGIGSQLLVTVFELAHELSRTVGCSGIVVDAKAGALSFYTALGFQMMDVRAGELEERPVPTPMYLHLSAVPRLHTPRD